MSIVQMQLLTITQGMFYSRVLQINNPGNPPTPAINVFDGTYTLSAAFWIGQNQSTIFAPTVSWWTNNLIQTGYTQGQVLFQTSAANTLALDPAGEYYATVYATDASGNQSAVVEVRVKILASPGSTVPGPPDLITLDYAEAALAGNRLTDSQRDFLPYAISAASKWWRRWCRDRDFNQQTYIDYYPVMNDGYCRLAQVPINQVLRVQSHARYRNHDQQYIIQRSDLSGDCDLRRRRRDRAGHHGDLSQFSKQWRHNIDSDSLFLALASHDWKYRNSHFIGRFRLDGISRKHIQQLACD